MDILLILVCGATLASASIGQWKRHISLENKEFENAKVSSTEHLPWKCVTRCYKENAVSLTHNDKTGACSCYDTEHDSNTPFTEQIDNVYFTVAYPQCRDQSHSGVLQVSADIRVFCDVSSIGNWMLNAILIYVQVFQRRLNGTEFWLGNENLHYLTSTGKWQLRYDVNNTQFGSVYNIYDGFRIGDASSKYTLYLGNRIEGNTVGNSGNLLYHNRQKFSAKDQDNDSSGNNCAEILISGWWFNSCYAVNFNSPKRVNCRAWSWYQTLDGCTTRAELKMRRVDV